MKKLMIATAVAGALGAGAAQAFTADYVAFLNLSNEWSGSPSAPYAKVEIDKVSSAQWDFLVTPLIASSGDNYGIMTFGFNVVATATNVAVSNLPANWAATSPGGQLDGWGSFDWKVDIEAQGSRQDPLAFTVTMDPFAGSGTPFDELSDVNSGTGQRFTVHIGDIACPEPECRVTSAWFAGSDTELPPAGVPEPGTYAMILAGLGLLGLVARRRTQFGI